VRKLIILSPSNILLASTTVSAAEDSFVGNTVRYIYISTITGCDGSGNCKVLLPYNHNHLIYIGKNHEIFDYDVNRSGEEHKLSEHVITEHRLSGDAGSVWKIRNNTLMHTVISKGSLGTVTLNVFVTSVGNNKCAVSQTATLPGYTLTPSIDLRSCEILPGHVER
jgi:hypothetical protein